MFTCLISSEAVWHTDRDADIMKVLKQMLNPTTTQLGDIERDLREA